METSEQPQSEASVGTSTIVVVQNRCQFCYAFFKDPDKIVEHSQCCEFRFSETFEAADGKVKFACAVSVRRRPKKMPHVIGYSFCRLVSMYSQHELPTENTRNCINFQVDFRVQSATEYF